LIAELRALLGESGMGEPDLLISESPVGPKRAESESRRLERAEMLAKRQGLLALRRAYLPALAVGLLLDDFGTVSGTAHGDTTQFLPRLLHRDKRVLEPIL
jgi:hypothetical protein